MVLCSRSARPEKGLVRRPHVDQHGCPSRRGKTSKLGQVIRSVCLFDARGKGHEAERETFPLDLVKTSVGGCFLGHDFQEFDFEH